MFWFREVWSKELPIKFPSFEISKGVPGEFSAVDPSETSALTAQDHEIVKVPSILKINI